MLGWYAMKNKNISKRKEKQKMNEEKMNEDIEIYLASDTLVPEENTIKSESPPLELSPNNKEPITTIEARELPEFRGNNKKDSN